MAIQSQDPNVIMKVGRWKTFSAFYDNNVHTKTPKILFSEFCIHFQKCLILNHRW